MLLASSMTPPFTPRTGAHMIAQTLLDLTSIGSASAATVSNLRPIFLSITVLILLDSIRRQGLNRHNLIRMLASGLVLLLPKVLGYYQKAVEIDAPKHSCH
jgi:hypothetical protein